MDGAVGSDGPQSRPAPTERLAILAPNYRAAQVEARERGLDEGRNGYSRAWFYVHSESDVLGRQPGRYAIRTWIGGRLSDDQWIALDRMIQRGWTPA